MMSRWELEDAAVRTILSKWSLVSDGIWDSITDIEH